MRISDWSSDVCSSDLVLGQVLAQLAGGALVRRLGHARHHAAEAGEHVDRRVVVGGGELAREHDVAVEDRAHFLDDRVAAVLVLGQHGVEGGERTRSEKHTSELQSLMRITYAVFCLKKTKK